MMSQQVSRRLIQDRASRRLLNTRIEDRAAGG